MSTSGRPIPALETPSPSRGPLRLRLAGPLGPHALDGGWWPRSQDLQVELVDLVDHFPEHFGRIVRALVSPADWEQAPRRVPVEGGYVKVALLSGDNTHLIHLTTSDRTVLRVLVVPPGLTDDQGDEALLAAATPRNASSATALLDLVTEYPDIDPMDHWTDDGGSWWGPDPVAPSFRRGS